MSGSGSVGRSKESLTDHQPISMTTMDGNSEEEDKRPPPVISGFWLQFTGTVEPHYNGSQGTDNNLLLLIDFCYCQYMKYMRDRQDGEEGKAPTRRYGIMDLMVDRIRRKNKTKLEAEESR